jgi:5-methylthioadenosine/S-adenosylhomocysteine deaminase
MTPPIPHVARIANSWFAPLVFSVRRQRSGHASWLIVALIILLGIDGNALWAQRTYAISGTLVTPRGLIGNGTMIVVNGQIESVGVNLTVPKEIAIIKTDGIVFPGLIDLHNHLVWNVFPRWTPPNPVGDRHEWQAMREYVARLSGPEGRLIGLGSGCDMERYAEIKALIAGATSVVGSYGPTLAAPHRNDCVKGLARNLDVFSGLYTDQVNAEPLRYEIFPFEIGWDQAKAIRDGLGSRDLRAVIFHVGEGKDASAAREFRMLKARGFLRPGVSVIHGVALREADFREMAANGVGFIWSPRSNLELYGKTADMEAAKAANVTIALAPDWSPTGSSGMLDELRVAVSWNRTHDQLFSDLELLQMAAANPARLAGLSDRIGSLAPGMMADFMILPKVGNSPLRSLLEFKPGSAQLVVVGGTPMVGTAEYMREFPNIKNTDSLSVCGQPMMVNIRQETGGESWSLIETRLQKALTSVGSSLAALSECDSKRQIRCELVGDSSMPYIPLTAPERLLPDVSRPPDISSGGPRGGPSSSRIGTP